MNAQTIEHKRFVVRASGYTNPGDDFSERTVVGSFDTLAEALAAPVPHNALHAFVQDTTVTARDHDIVAQFDRTYQQRRNRSVAWQSRVLVEATARTAAHWTNGETLGAVVWSDEPVYSALPID